MYKEKDANVAQAVAMADQSVDLFILVSNIHKKGNYEDATVMRLGSNKEVQFLKNKWKDKVRQEMRRSK